VDDVRDSYDRVAADYVERIAGELEHKPFDRAYLDRLAADLADAGPVAELGCGPGHVGRYLHDRGVSVSGLDLSRGMIEEARRLNPGMEFVVGDMLDLPYANESLAALVAFYAIIHFDSVQLDQALQEFQRVLRPGGLAAVAFHVGEETLHRDEWWGHRISFDFHLLQPADVSRRAVAAGLTVEELVEREPYSEVEYPSRRTYMRLRKPGTWDVSPETASQVTRPTWNREGW
jgi:SAM-dependent methyltransferase